MTIMFGFYPILDAGGQCCSMKSFLLPVLPLLFFASTEGRAQPVFPGAGPVFNDSLVPRIDILIHPDSLDVVFGYPGSYHEYPATFIFRAGSLADTVEQVGFRLRGNTSRYSGKKSFKVSFNTFFPGRKFHGLEKMNINGEHNDPSVIRSKLCWDILRRLGVPASRANHVELYINGDYYGLYINVEHIDEEFVRLRFRNNDGNLYKCLWPADLVYFSSDPEDYKFENEDRRTYDLRTNTREDNYEDLYRLIRVLNVTSDAEFPCELEGVFNVDDYLKIMAFDVICGNWDDYSYLKNNYYLYRNTASGKFEFIPYDLDNTLGIDWIGRDWATRDIYDWANHGEERPLHTRILGIQKYRDQYSHYLEQLITEILDTAVFFPRIDSLHEMITPYIENDPYYPNSYGYDIGDFHRSYEEALGEHAAYGLKPFIMTRTGTALSSLESNPILPVINYIRTNHPRLGETAVVSAFVPGDSTVPELLYSFNWGNEESIVMKDDGVEPDRMAGDRIFTARTGPLDSPGQISCRIRASSSSGTAAEPCRDIQISVFESFSPDLVINEFMAGNASARMDEYGEYDDWVEIFNRDPSPVWLGDKYLSDDTLNPSRWKLPDLILDPSGFALIWVDGQNGQGPMHANFRLNKNGEEIGIFESPERNSAIIDFKVFGSQSDDVSYGRSSDGTDEWISFILSTPGYSNLSVRVAPVHAGVESIRAYPNPAAGEMVFFSRIASVRLHDLSGRILSETWDTDRIYVGSLPAGVYFLKFSGGEVIRIIVL